MRHIISNTRTETATTTSKRNIIVDYASSVRPSININRYHDVHVQPQEPSSVQIQQRPRIGHGTGEKKPHRCQICFQTFYNAQECSFHEQNHQSRPTTDIFVSFLNRNLDAAVLPNPKPTTTTNIIKFSADSSSSTMDSDAMRVMTCISPYFSCNLCTSTYNDKQSLKRHVKWRHYYTSENQNEALNLISRPAEPQSAVSKDAVLTLALETSPDSSHTSTSTSHVSSVHPPMVMVNSGASSSAGPQYTRNNEQLTSRKRKRKYICTLCGCRLSSFSAAALHSHFHRGVKPFTCQYCSKTLTRIDSWQSHESIHTNQKRLICHLCHGQFRWRGGLRSHLRRYHKIV